ncbi:hypothetical protein CGLO_07885 [Colletotrichum gloeosporioides Cg-14]|uniref:Uncharacterized protein n=1 Tax=Colletotrichum gloeosporioides (strain Cg-14) TaxID=1237896 RepID=T0KI45_COLGC|nr:hypothetical protein CGLO_07885 [Colletotrichum gloeosporioides Cg-14]
MRRLKELAISKFAENPKAVGLTDVTGASPQVLHCNRPRPWTWSVRIASNSTTALFASPDYTVIVEPRL